jgi:hypothetical protein
MTASELIKELQEWPQDKEVLAGPNDPHLGPVQPVVTVNYGYGWLLTEPTKGL